jgi:hypothetical protein
VAAAVGSFLGGSPAVAFPSPAGKGEFVRTDEFRVVVTESASGAVSLRDQFHKLHAVEWVERLETVLGVIAVAWEGVRNLGLPATAIGAKQDPLHPPVVARLWKARIDDATPVTVPARDIDPEGYAAVMDRITSDHVIAWRTL